MVAAIEVIDANIVVVRIAILLLQEERTFTQHDGDLQFSFEPTPPPRRPQVIVLGAGAAGLAAARRLQVTGFARIQLVCKSQSCMVSKLRPTVAGRWCLCVGLGGERPLGWARFDTELSSATVRLWSDSKHRAR